MAQASVLGLQLDAQWHVLAVNPHAANVLGRPCTGDPFDSLLVTFDDTTIEHQSWLDDTTPRRLTLATAQGRPRSFWFRFYSHDAGCLALGWWDMDEQTQLQTELLGVNRELSNVTRQLHQANADLQEANQLKDRFLGMAAHDLRRPLGVVSTYVEFVLDDYRAALGEDACAHLQTALRATQQMARMVDDFLDTSLIAAGRLPITRQPIDVHELLANALQLVRVVADRKGVLLAINSADIDQPVLVDGPKIQQVLANLIGNAIEHSANGQTVHITAQRDDRLLRVDVRDEGAGLSEVEQAGLFEPFAVAGTRKTASERSVGLGLAIARAIVEAHDGTIAVESQPGQGATFWFTLPLPKGHLRTHA